MFLHADCWLKPAGQKKKSVRFGTPLSPEVFDKTLPASTPLRKGGTPARTPTPGGGLKLRSALKASQVSDSDTPDSGPDPCSPSGMGASPPLVRLGRKSEAGDGEEEKEEGEMVASGLYFLFVLQKLQLNFLCRLCRFLVQMFDLNVFSSDWFSVNRGDGLRGA